MAFKIRAPPKAQVPVIKVKTLSMRVCCDPESFPPGLQGSSVCEEEAFEGLSGVEDQVWA